MHRAVVPGSGTASLFPLNAVALPPPRPFLPLLPEWPPEWPLEDLLECPPDDLPECPPDDLLDECLDPDFGPDFPPECVEAPAPPAPVNSIAIANPATSRRIVSSEAPPNGSMARVAPVGPATDLMQA